MRQYYRLHRRQWQSQNKLRIAKKIGTKGMYYVPYNKKDQYQEDHEKSLLTTTSSRSHCYRRGLFMKPGKLQRGMPLLWILRGHMVNANVMPQLCEKIKVCLNRRHNLIKLFMASASIQPGVVTPTERVTQYNIYKIKKGISIKILFESKQFIFLLRQNQAIKNKRMNIVIFGEG